MIVFNLIINTIEAFIFPYFLSFYFDFNNKSSFILISGFIQLLTLTAFNHFNNNGFILTAIIILINVISLYIKKSKLYLNDIFITILYNCILLFTTYISIIIVNILPFVSIKISNSLYKYIIICILAKIILFLITFIIIRQKTNFSINLNDKNWNLIVLFELLLMLGSVSICFSIANNFFDLNHLYYYLVYFILINITFIIIIYKINKLYKENLYYMKQKQMADFYKEKVYLIKDLKNEIDAIDHRLFYIIYKIDYLLSKKDYAQINQLLQTYKNTVLKHKMIIETGNDIFDALLSLKINDMISKEIDIKTCIFISKNNFYNNVVFIKNITELLDCFALSKIIQIYIKENLSFLTIEIIFENNNINNYTLKDYLENNFKNLYKFDTEIDKKNTNKVSLVMKINN